MSVGAKASASSSAGSKSKSKNNDKAEDHAVKGSNNAFKAAKIKAKVAMWAIARKRISCSPQPDAVCGGRRVACIPLPSAICSKSSVRTQTTQNTEFLAWLKNRGEGSSAAITIGMSSHGRALFACRPICHGEVVLEVSRDLMVTPVKLPEDISRLLSKNVSEWAQLALFLLAHQHLRQASAWAPYISCLPRLGHIHSTIFWRKEELAYLNLSPLHRETVDRRGVVKMEYETVENVLQLCPQMFGDQVSFDDFKHAYATVCSRAWGLGGVGALALVPFVDFFNHDAFCRALLAFDDARECAEVIADRDYATGEEVVISYGQLSNATLALDFGFALPFNPHDQAEIWMCIAAEDPLRESKLQLLHSHSMQTLVDAEGVDTGGCAFILRGVRSPTGKGKGIPQPLRAFARVICATTSQELDEMAESAAASDGRLARRPSTDNSKELKAMTLLLKRVECRIQEYTKSILALRSSVLQKPRKEIAEAVLDGELSVFYSALAWLKEQCKTLMIEN